jgi:hypothetical protein
MSINSLITSNDNSMAEMQEAEMHTPPKGMKPYPRLLLLLALLLSPHHAARRRAARRG